MCLYGPIFVLLQVIPFLVHIAIDDDRDAAFGKCQGARKYRAWFEYLQKHRNYAELRLNYPFITICSVTTVVTSD